MIHACQFCGTESDIVSQRDTCPRCRQERHVIRSRAHVLVRGARLRGELPQPQALICVDCGKDADVYDHRDYSEPLQVAAVCHSCNQLRGPAHYAYRAQSEPAPGAPATPSQEAA